MEDTKSITMRAARQYRKGAAIKFVAGVYCGKEGWINEDGKKSDTYYYVIVDLGRQRPKLTHVKQTSVAFKEDIDKVPLTPEHAILQEFEDVDRTMDKLAKILTECKIFSFSSTLADIMNVKIEKVLSAQEIRGARYPVYRNVTPFSEWQKKKRDKQGSKESRENNKRSCSAEQEQCFV